MSDAPKLVLGTALVVGRHGVLLRGPSGVGKSSLAMALLGRETRTRPIRLVADDAVHAVRHGVRLVVTPPPATRGLIEARGAGLRRVPFVERAVLALVVDLVYDVEERLPEEAQCVVQLCGADVPRVEIDPKRSAATDIVLAVVDALEAGLAPPFNGAGDRREH